MMSMCKHHQSALSEEEDASDIDIDNFVFDTMHDILEGVAQYEVKLLFEYLK